MFPTMDLWIGFKMLLADIVDGCAMSEPMLYNNAASTMEMEGYTDLEILQQLGPEPKIRETYWDK